MILCFTDQHLMKVILLTANAVNKACGSRMCESFTPNTATHKNKGWYLKDSRMAVLCSESQHMYINKVHVIENPTVTMTRWKEICCEQQWFSWEFIQMFSSFHSIMKECEQNMQGLSFTSQIASRITRSRKVAPLNCYSQRGVWYCSSLAKSPYFRCL